MTSLVGISIGAGDIHRAEKIGWVGGLAAALLAGTIGLVLAAFPNAWIPLFSDDPEGGSDTGDVSDASDDEELEGGSNASDASEDQELEGGSNASDASNVSDASEDEELKGGDDVSGIEDASEDNDEVSDLKEVSNIREGGSASDAGETNNDINSNSDDQNQQGGNSENIKVIEIQE